LRNGDADPYGIVESVEVENVKVLNERFSKELELFRRSFNLLVEAIIDIHNKLQCSESHPLLARNLAFTLISAKFILSSKALLNLSLNGYPYEANVLSRTMLEDLLRLHCFLKDEKSAEEWLTRNLNVKKAKCIAPELSLDEHFKWLYNWLSHYVHTNPPSLSSLTEVSNERIQVKISPILPHSTEDQAAIVIVPLAFNFIFLKIIMKACEEKIESDIKKRILQLTEQILFHFEKFIVSS